MRTEIKFCGLMRPEDAAAADALGASYVGVIFAGGPRRVDASAAARLFTRALRATRVGVFGAQSSHDVGRLARAADLKVVQLHGDPDPTFVRAVREEFGGAVWAVVRTTSTLPEAADALFASADAVVLDAKVPGRLGGTGAALDWNSLRRPLERVRGGTPVVLAGGLTPENVGDAIAALDPAVVDVSSGVEKSPGFKDHARMRAFVDAVRASEAFR